MTGEKGDYWLAFEIIDVMAAAALALGNSNFATLPPSPRPPVEGRREPELSTSDIV